MVLLRRTCTENDKLLDEHVLQGVNNVRQIGSVVFGAPGGAVYWDAIYSPKGFPGLQSAAIHRHTPNRQSGIIIAILNIVKYNINIILKIVSNIEHHAVDIRVSSVEDRVKFKRPRDLVGWCVVKS